jgi:hypothetical protein
MAQKVQWQACGMMAEECNNPVSGSVKSYISPPKPPSSLYIPLSLFFKG